MDDSEKVSSTDPVFFENSRISLEGYSVQSHFRRISIISVNSSHHAPREDDTVISVSVQTEPCPWQKDHDEHRN